MAPSTPPVRVLDQFQVYPPPESVPDSTLPLTYFDALYTFFGPTKRLYFYPLPCSTEHFVAHHLPNLISSLSLTLKHFYPLAGKVTPSPDSCPDALNMEIQYRAGDSVPLTLAECYADFHQLSGDHPREVGELCHLVPQIPSSSDYTAPLLALQVTVFPAHGVCLGLAVHHVACDGKSSTHFVKAWAAACRSQGSEDLSSQPLPSYNRTTLPAPIWSPWRTWAEKEAQKAPPSPPKELLFIATFTLKPKQIEQLKQRVLAKIKASDEHAVVHCSTFVVACASAWKCLSIARGRWESKKRAYLAFVADCRGRMNPRLPAEYFGNCIRPCFVELDMGDLTKEDGGILEAAEAIGREILGLADGDIMDGSEWWAQKAISWFPEQPMMVAGSPKFRLYETNFGWGAPSKTVVVSTPPNHISLSESRKEHGGIEISVVLPKSLMEEFSSCFANDLELL